MISFLISFAFCMVILLILLRFANIHWIIKAFLTIASLMIVYSFYISILWNFGWPVDMKPTGTILVEGSDIREPDSKSSGAIYIWFIDIEESNRTKQLQPPRSIIIPYDKETHKNLSKAGEQTAAGIPVYMKFGKSKKGIGDNPNASSSDSELNFIEPPKTTPLKP